MRLIEGIGKTWHRLWSVRLALLASLLGAAECGYQTYLTGHPPLVSLVATLLSLSAAVARIVAQPKLHKDDHE